MGVGVSFSSQNDVEGNNEKQQKSQTRDVARWCLGHQIAFSSGVWSLGYRRGAQVGRIVDVNTGSYPSSTSKGDTVESQQIQD